jgi:septum formation inhibitor MinC
LVLTGRRFRRRHRLAAPPSQSEHPATAAAAAPDQAKTEAATKAKTTKAKSAVRSGAQVVEEPTLREELDDDIPW